MLMEYYLEQYARVFARTDRDIWNYEDGCVLIGLNSLWEATGDGQYFDAIRLPKGFTKSEYALPTIRTDATGDEWICDLSATIGKGNSAFKIKSTSCGLDITTGGYWEAEAGELLSTRKLMNDQGFEMECRLLIEEYPDPNYNPEYDWAYQEH